jgi:hypothetical protein
MMGARCIKTKIIIIGFETSNSEQFFLFSGYVNGKVNLCFDSLSHKAELLKRHTRVGQNNGNTTETVCISTLIWSCTTSAFNTAIILLEMDSYKF